MSIVIKKILIALIYTVTILLLTEFGLRVFGFTPIKKKEHNGVSRHEFDNRIGWKLKNGNFHIPVNKHGDSMKYQMSPKMGRAVRNADTTVEDSESIYFIGGSFTFGYGVNDDETFVWKLQEKFPLFDFKNLAVGAYGTYQSLLCLEDQLSKGQIPDVVIYGLIGNHKWRNVAQSNWLQAMHENAGDQGVMVPYVTLHKGKTLSREKPTALRLLPFSENFALISVVQIIYNHIITSKREQDADQVLHLLIREMKNLCNQHGIHFYVSTLYYPPNEINQLFKIFELNEIDYIDCNIHLSEANTVKDDGHPLPEVHRYWAQEIELGLTKDNYLFPETNHPL